MTDPNRGGSLDKCLQSRRPEKRILRDALSEANGINSKIGVFVTHVVGTMWCAYLFTIVALLGLPSALRPGGEGIVAWVAQTFLQLVLLSVVLVGQNVQSLAADARSAKNFTDTEVILDRLDISTEGGIKAILDTIDRLQNRAV